MMATDTRNSNGATCADYLILMIKWRRVMAAIFILSIFVVALVSLAMPTMYRAEARILPAQQSTSGPAAHLLNQLGSFGAAPGFVGVKSPNDLYIGLMRSTGVLDRLVERFGLMSAYKCRYRQDVRRKLTNRMIIQDDKKSGLIVVGIEDQNPQRSAELTNAVIDELKKLTQNIALSEASQRRLFFEQQLKETKDALTRSEDSLKGYQEQTGAIDMKEQARATIESITRLRAQIAAKEVELGVVKTHSTQRNPDRQRLEEELSGLRQQVSRLQSGRSGKGDALLPVGKMPGAGSGSARKIRDLKYNETLYELLAKQYEMARLDEAREAVIIQVLDTATPPERKVKPRRTLMIAVAAASGMFLSIITAFILEYRERILADPDVRERLAYVWRHGRRILHKGE